MVTIFFSDVWLKFWLEDVQAFKIDCLNQANGTQIDCDPNLMDLPNAVYYRTVYIGNCYIFFQPPTHFIPLLLVLKTWVKL